MSMETVERYLKELEAIKHYSQVKADKERLSRENEKIKANLDDALKEVSSLKNSKAKLDGADMTLEEARLDFIHAQDVEVEKRIVERFEKLKADYESQMPQMVYQRLLNILKQPWLPVEIAKLINTEAEKKADDLLKDQNSWPDWFKKLYKEAVEKKVSAGLNQEFDKRVEEAATTRAQQKLSELINNEWPEWSKTNINPKITELERKLYAGVFEMLKGPWSLTCDRCGTGSNIELSMEEIEQLLGIGLFKIACSNPACEDRGFFSTGRHTFSVSLHNLLESFLT